MNRRKRILADLDADIRDHIARETQDNIDRGMSPQEARFAALRKFGNVSQIKEKTREVWIMVWLEQFLQDIRFSLRMLRKSPGFTAVAILTLALGIGANTAIFSLIDAVMLKSLPVRDPQQLVVMKWVAHTRPKINTSSSYGDCLIDSGEPSGCSLSMPFVADVRSNTTAFSGFATFASAGTLNLSGNGPASLASTQYVSGDYFETLGVRAAIGRTIQLADDTPASQAVAVLNYGYWQSAFGGDPSAVGKIIHLQEIPVTIVGVADPRFTHLTPGSTHDLWIPLAQRSHLRPGWDQRLDGASSWWLVVVARLKPEFTRAQAENSVSLLFFNDLVRGDKPLSKAEDAPAVKLLPAQSGLSGRRESLSEPLFVLMLAVGIVLLIACANVAGLMLARADRRQKEMALRLAIGASRGRIARQLITESLTISIAGGLLGVAFAFWSARALLAFLTSTDSRPTGFSTAIDFRVLAFTAAVSIFTGVIFGLIPALRSIRVDLTPTLKDGIKSSASRHAGRNRFNSGSILVVAQVALTVVVLVGAGLLVHTLENLRSIDPGFATNNMLNFSVDATLTHYHRARMGQFFRELRDRFTQIPNVTSVTYADTPLLSGSLDVDSFRLHGKQDEASSEADFIDVGPDYFKTMQIPITLGRDFLPPEYVNAASEPGAKCSNASLSHTPVAAIVNDSFVKAYFANENPLGQRFGGGTDPSCPDPGWQVVGIVHDARYSDLRREVHPTFYAPIPGDGTFELRTNGDPRATISSIREVLRRSGFDLPLFDIETESQQIDDLLFQERMIARLSSLFASLALLLACIGLYGLLSYEVARRTREIGIRMALGAQSGDMRRRVVGQGIALAAIGAAIGIAASFGVTRFLGAMLFEVKPSDPLTLIGVAALLLAVALIACYIPARRATRVDPLVTMRYE